MQYELNRKNRVKRKNKSKDSNRIRIIFSLFVFFLIASLYIMRVFQLSIFSDELKKRAMEQSQATITIKGKRGEILSRDGQVIAKDIVSYSVWINPRSISEDENKTQAIFKMAKILGLKPKEIKNKIEKNSYFVWLKRKISEEDLKNVMSIAKQNNLSKSDIGYIKEWKRFFPYGEALAHILGFVNIDSQGIAGLELQFDDFLKGGEVKVSFLKDALGNIIMRAPPQEPQPGSRIETTIDLELQMKLYKELKEQVENMRAKGAFAIAINPQTGEVLSAVSLPSFDPNNYSAFAGTRNINAQFYQTIFEPGSVFKIFTIASAIEEGIISKNDTFFCHNGKWTFSGITIEDVKPIGYATVEEVFAKSSNICTAQISLLLGKERFYRYLDRLGFGKKTGIELPGEERGILHDYRKWYDVDLAIIGFGYFVSVNALQVIRAFSAFANGGYIVKPYIVRKIISPYGEVLKENKPSFSDRVFSQQTVEEMKGFMRSVVTHGTGRLAEVPLFLSCGKTGTARKMKNGKYVKEYYSNFIGFSPCDDPKIALFVVFDEPEEKYYGGEVAAPVFAKVVESYLSSKYPFMIQQNSQGEFSQSISNSRMTLSEFINSIPQEKTGKNIIIKGHGFVKKVEEDEDEIFVFLSP